MFHIHSTSHCGSSLLRRVRFTKRPPERIRRPSRGNRPMSSKEATDRNEFGGPAGATVRYVVLGRINRVQNNIRSIFAQRGMELMRGQKAWALERYDEIAQHRQPLAECSLDELWRGELDLELEQLDHLRQHQQEIDQRLQVLARADQRVQLLETIPGVGRKTAEVVVAYLDDPHRFRNARQVSSYAGMVPRRYQSGEMDRQGRIHKRGPRQLRSALVEAAWLMLRYNPWARSVYERLTGGQKTRKKKAIVAVARKLLVRCWVMLLRKEPWQSGAPDRDVSCSGCLMNRRYLNLE